MAAIESRSTATLVQHFTMHLLPIVCIPLERVHDPEEHLLLYTLISTSMHQVIVALDEGH
jgi:hypothetical protein